MSETGPPSSFPVFTPLWPWNLGPWHCCQLNHIVLLAMVVVQTARMSSSTDSATFLLHQPVRQKSGLLPVTSCLFPTIYLLLSQKSNVEKRYFNSLIFPTHANDHKATLPPPSALQPCELLPNIDPHLGFSQQPSSTPLTPISPPEALTQPSPRLPSSTAQSPSPPPSMNVPPVRQPHTSTPSSNTSLSRDLSDSDSEGSDPISLWTRWILTNTQRMKMNVQPMSFYAPHQRQQTSSLMDPKQSFHIITMVLPNLVAMALSFKPTMHRIECRRLQPHLAFNVSHLLISRHHRHHRHRCRHHRKILKAIPAPLAHIHLNGRKSLATPNCRSGHTSPEQMVSQILFLVLKRPENALTTHWQFISRVEVPWSLVSQIQMHGLDLTFLVQAIVMDMVIFRTIFFELLVFFTFTLLTFHFTY